MKKIEWLNNNKMKFESDLKTFNKEVKCIFKGSAFSNTQISYNIRSYNNTNCNGYEFQKGELMESDLKHFKNLPHIIYQILTDKNRQEDLILYQFNYSNNIIGWILTDKNNNLIIKKSNGNFVKREQCLNEIAKYIVND